MTTLIQPQEITNAGVLKAAPISSRFDAALLSAHIKPAEIRFLRPIICEEFYLYLIEQKGGTVSNYNAAICPDLAEAFPTAAELETLWREYLLPFLSYAVLWQALPTIGVQIASAGIFSGDTYGGQGQGIEGVKFLQDSILTTIEIMQADLLRYLCKNKSVYPLFCAECVCPCESSDCCDDKTASGAPGLGVVFYDKNDNNKQTKTKKLWL